MKILHLYSDWRWTGPAGPTIDLVKALGEKGLSVVFACRRPPVDHPQSIEKEAKKKGVHVLTSFHLNRYFNLGDLFWDLRRLPRYLRREGFDIVHCHLSHDHFLGSWAAKRGGNSIPVVRTNHKGLPLRVNAWNRWLICHWTDGLVTFSTQAALGDARNFGFPKENVCLVHGAVDLDYFDPQKVVGNPRDRFGFAPSDVVVGMVARMQRHRRFDVFLNAIAWVKERFPSIKVLILGRGTHMQKVAVEPSREMGLSEQVIFGGYRKEDYREALSCIDLKVFLVPGSDGTCRAVREAMALGKPVVAARRGMLPEIVDHGRTGFLVRDTPQELGKAILRLAEDPSLRQRMGEEARKEALERFRIEIQAERIIELYSQLAH